VSVPKGIRVLFIDPAPGRFFLQPTRAGRPHPDSSIAGGSGLEKAVQGSLPCVVEIPPFAIVEFYRMLCTGRHYCRTIEDAARAQGYAGIVYLDVAGDTLR
jgi:hypothetical protein